MTNEWRVGVNKPWYIVDEHGALMRAASFRHAEVIVKAHNATLKPDAMREGEPVAWVERECLNELKTSPSHLGIMAGTKHSSFNVPLYLAPPTVNPEMVAYFNKDKWGGYWQTVWEGKPYNFRIDPGADKATLEQAVAAEREACARIIDKAWLTEGGQAETVRLKGLASAIRARANGGV